MIRLLMFVAGLVLIAMPAVFSRSDEFLLSGSVRAARTGEPIPNAIVRVEGASRGTICNSEGNYHLRLPEGQYTLVASCLAYGADTVVLTLAANAALDFVLTPSEIDLPEIIVTGEDPAYAIIRQAIANKRNWINRLKSYQMEAFTRQVLRKDTTIASVTEAITKGYWRQGDTLREVTRQRRQTENIDQGMNFASVGRILNFYDENVRFLGYSFPGPIADDAFDHYRYKLLRTLTSQDNEVCEIEMKPRSNVIPQFSGMMSIAGGTFALVAVDVEPNQTFLLPFVKEKRIRYRQQFAQFERTYWLPADIRIEGRFTIGVPLFSVPTIGFSQTSVITDYEINVPIPDSIFQKPRLVVDSSAAKYDSTLWSGSAVLPLTAEERSAYATLDSSKTLEVQFRPGGILMTLGGGDSGAASTIIDVVDLSFNRVEGAHLGIRYSTDDLTSWLGVRGGVAYGLSDKQTKFSGGLTVFPTVDKKLQMGVAYEQNLTVIPEGGFYGTVFNSLTSLLVRNDYSDYYKKRGWKVFASYSPGRIVRTKVSFLLERHSSVEKSTDFGILRSAGTYRNNPRIDVGDFRTVLLEVGLGREAVPLDLVSRNTLDLSVEHSIGGRFDFVRYHASGTALIPTMGRRFLAPAVLRLRLSAGASGGSLPRQRMFSIESASSGLGPFGVMRGMRVKEFLGLQYVALNVEHNFRSLPFLWLDIPFLYRNNIEFIIHGGAATSATEEFCRITCSGLPDTNGWYSEIGFGISRIFELVRCDFTWRLSSPRSFHFTIAVSNLL